jgi:hypothetical protein
MYVVFVKGTGKNVTVCASSLNEAIDDIKKQFCLSTAAKIKLQTENGFDVTDNRAFIHFAVKDVVLQYKILSEEEVTFYYSYVILIE